MFSDTNNFFCSKFAYVLNLVSKWVMHIFCLPAQTVFLNALDTQLKVLNITMLLYKSGKRKQFMI